jgi:hypothetical protein
MKKFIPFVCCLFLFVTQGSVDAQSITKLGDNYYSAGIPTLEFYQVGEIDRQRCPEWCWAASSQMILNYHGLYVTQEQIVTKIFGSLECRPGTPSDIMNGLTGWAPDTRGRFSTIHSIYGISSTADIVQNLAYKWPLLVCLSNPDGSGHAEVMTAVYYAVDAYNNPIIDKVVLRDPWPYNPSRQEMSWAEFSSRATAIIRVWVERN